ncbi:type VI secretion system-associated FHA domain protein TagH [Methylobacterium symbioticum]|nr:type VI secretion system-associated FHA domain protein TagH [uncultured Methylobacterium sp.]
MMTLTLTIENFTVLPDAGPLSISLSGRRGIDIGRDQYLDWTLPDPDRVISGKHAEIRHRDGGYWLQDVSRNGTFLNRNPQRLQEACRLKDGDRIQIGQYVILVQIAGAAAPAEAPPALPPADPRDYWDLPGEAPPVPSHSLRPASALRPVRPDFIDWAVDMPGHPGPAGSPRPEPPREMDWARAAPPTPPPPTAPMPTPRRPAETPHAFDPPLGAPPPFAAPPVAAPPFAAPPLAPSPPAEPLPPAAPPAALPDSPWNVPDAGRPARPPESTPGERAPRDSAPRGAEAPARAPLDGDEFVRRFAAGLGIPPEILGWQDPGDLAEEAGRLLRLSADNVKQLLAARTESKRVAKAASQTTIQALDNNPLKFSPTVDDALRIMLGRPSSGFLEARRALESSFRDLKTHQVKTYGAMQNALRLLMEDLSPEGIEASDEKDRGLGGLLGSRKARLWDIYTARWDTLASPHDDGMVDAFMMFFSDCYDKSR